MIGQGKTDFMSLLFGEDQFLFSTNQQLVPRLTPDKFLPFAVVASVGEALFNRR